MPFQYRTLLRISVASGIAHGYLAVKVRANGRFACCNILRFLRATLVAFGGKTGHRSKMTRSICACVWVQASGCQEPVACACLGSNDCRIGRVRFDLGAQLADEHAQILGVVMMGWPPDRGQNLSMCNNSPGIAGKNRE